MHCGILIKDKARETNTSLGNAATPPRCAMPDFGDTQATE